MGLPIGDTIVTFLPGVFEFRSYINPKIELQNSLSDWRKLSFEPVTREGSDANRFRIL